jgi:hypothetical protein
MQTKGTSTGILRKELENKLKTLSKNREWERFMDLFAFTIYGVLLFPSGNEVISLAAIDVFINYNRNGKNAVTHACMHVLRIK